MLRRIARVSKPLHCCLFRHIGLLQPNMSIICRQLSTTQPTNILLKQENKFNNSTITDPHVIELQKIYKHRKTRVSNLLDKLEQLQLIRNQDKSLEILINKIKRYAEAQEYMDKSDFELMDIHINENVHRQIALWSYKIETRYSPRGDESVTIININ